VADDDLDIQSLVALKLERSGYSVLRASDGAEALELALRERPDLAVLDITMPKLDGRAGATAYVKKPFSPQELDARASSIIG